MAILGVVCSYFSSVFPYRLLGHSASLTHFVFLAYPPLWLRLRVVPIVYAYVFKREKPPFFLFRR